MSRTLKPIPIAPAHSAHAEIQNLAEKSLSPNQAPGLSGRVDPVLRADGTPLRVAFTTLGCKLNQYESDAVAAEFTSAGYQVGDFDRDADIQIVNTCTVTDRADRKSRNAINRAQRLLTPLRTAAHTDAGTHALTERVPPQPAASEIAPEGAARLVVMTGCYVEGARDKLESDGRTIVVPNELKSNIFSMVDAILRGEMDHPAAQAVAAIAPVSQVFAYKATDTSFHARGTVKIQDGCDNFCTFCIIPFVRGRAKSRALPEILDNVRQVVANGVREVVLSGVNMSRYRWNQNEPGSAGDDTAGAPAGLQGAAGDLRFADVVRAILDLPLDFRVRISSIEPDQLGPDFVDLFKHSKMCPQLHLCLQSGSDRVLLAMRRQYNLAEYRSLVTALREIDPDFALSTDIIVGFPGETEADFQASLDAAREFGFSQIHVFPYSVRGGTRAERMPGKLSHAEIDARSDRLKALGAELKRTRRQKAVGGSDEMIVERVQIDSADRVVRLTGTGKYFFPIELTVHAEQLDRILPGGDRDPRNLRTKKIEVKIKTLSKGDEPVLIGG